jgi:hypothetical protein
MAGEKKELKARIEKELAEKTEKLKRDLTQQNEKMQRTLGEVMEGRDGLQKTLMEERQQWKKKHCHVEHTNRRNNGRRGEKCRGTRAAEEPRRGLG